MVFYALLNAILVVFLSVILTTVGVKVFTRTFKQSRQPFAFEMGAGFFIASALFLSLWRIVAHFSTATIGLYSTVFIFALLAPFPIQNTKKLWSDSWSAITAHKARSILVALVLPTLLLIYWMIPDPQGINVWSHLGSVHSPRYANIAVYIYENNTIPIFGQNYEQSLLASIPLFFGLGSPIFNLFLWLSVSIIALVSLLLGFYQSFSFPRRWCTYAMLLTLGSSVALSFLHIHVFDNGSPLLLTGYSDLARSVGSFFVFLLILKTIFENKKIDISYFLLILLTLSVSWAISAPQNTFLSLCLLGSLFCFRLKANLSQVGSAFVLIALTTALVSPMGGMFSSRAVRDMDVPGVINDLEAPQTNHLAINPLVPFGVPGSLWQDFLKSARFTVSSFSEINTLQELVSILLLIEINLWIALKTMFFPLLGLLTLGTLLYHPKISLWIFEKETALKPPLTSVWVVSLATFFFGFCVVFPFDVSWYRWPLTRFLIMGYTLGTTCLVFSAYLLYRQLGQWGQRVLWFGLAFCLLIGPAFGLFSTILTSVYQKPQFTEIAHYMLNHSGYTVKDPHVAAASDSSSESTRN